MSTIEEMEITAKRGADGLAASMRGFHIAFCLVEILSASGLSTLQVTEALDRSASELWGPGWRDVVDARESR